MYSLIPEHHLAESRESPTRSGESWEGPSYLAMRGHQCL